MTVEERLAAIEAQLARLLTLVDRVMPLIERRLATPKFQRKKD